MQGSFYICKPILFGVSANTVSHLHSSPSRPQCPPTKLLDGRSQVLRSKFGVTLGDLAGAEFHKDENLGHSPVFNVHSIYTGSVPISHYARTVKTY